MENLDQNNEKYSGQLEFFGEGSKYFGIVVINLILTILTIGLYYPWAKAAFRRYIWNETEFKDSRFVFHGTGREMFKGFLIAYAIIIGFYVSLGMASLYTYAYAFIIIFYILLILLIPFALYGAWRYRVSRTSWRGIYFSFDGNFSEFLKMFFKEILLTIITIGIYSAWMRVNLQKYLFSHTSLGGIRFNFHGKGGDLFVINLIAYLLIYPTLAMYIPIWIKNRFNFTVNHTSLSDGNNKALMHSFLSNGTAWKTLMINALLLIVTLGLAFPWTFMRKLDMYFNNVYLPEDFDYDNLSQSEQSYKDATGDEMLDILDMGIDF